MTEFFEHKKYSYQRSQITNENEGLILCDDKAEGWFGMWARACWHQETNILLFFSHQVRLNLAVPSEQVLGKVCCAECERTGESTSPAVLRAEALLGYSCCAQGQEPLCRVCAVQILLFRWCCSDGFLQVVLFRFCCSDDAVQVLFRWFCSGGAVQTPLCLLVPCMSSCVRCVTCSAELHQLKGWCWAVPLLFQVSLGISYSPGLFLL